MSFTIVISYVKPIYSAYYITRPESMLPHTPEIRAESLQTHEREDAVSSPVNHKLVQSGPPDVKHLRRNIH